VKKITAPFVKGTKAGGIAGEKEGGTTSKDPFNSSTLSRRPELATGE